MKQSTFQWSTASNCVTLIESVIPKAVCKTYTLNDEGKIKKKAVASIVEGKASSVLVPDAKALIKLIERVAELELRVSQLERENALLRARHPTSGGAE
jgi:hypothetical protein